MYLTHKPNYKRFNRTPYPGLNPYIIKLSSYYSVIGATTLITIYGSNFRDYSTINIGTISVPIIFLNSSQISFYVPIHLKYGTYAIQVINDTYVSNTVNFNIDNTGSFWTISPITNSISNLNSGDVYMNCSVFNKFVQSYSIPGAYLYDISNNNYPIFTTISNYQHFYSNSSFKDTNSSILDLENQDKAYLISPGYKLQVYDSSSRDTPLLDIENISRAPIYQKPSTEYTGQSCKLYFYTNSSWEIISPS
jgi:hypothetical protein